MIKDMNDIEFMGKLVAFLKSEGYYLGLSYKEMANILIDIAKNLSQEKPNETV